MARKTGKTVASLVMGTLAVGNVQAAAMDDILGQDAQTTFAQRETLKQEAEDAKTTALDKAALMFGKNDSQKLTIMRGAFPSVLTDVGENKANLIQLGIQNAEYKVATETALAQKADKTDIQATDNKATAAQNTANNAATAAQTADNKAAAAQRTADRAQTIAASAANRAELLQNATTQKFTELDTKLSNKADKAKVEDLAKTVADIETTTVTELDKLQNEKADKADLDKKADKTEVTQFANRIITVENTVEQHTQDITTLHDQKADKIELVKVADRVTTVESTVVQHAADIANLNTQVSNHGKQIQQTNQRIVDLEEQTEKGLAAQAALTGLFQPYRVGKFNVSAALGGYKSKTAIAVGGGYRFNETVAIKAGIATSTRGGGAAYNIGVNFEW